MTTNHQNNNKHWFPDNVKIIPETCIARVYFLYYYTLGNLRTPQFKVLNPIILLPMCFLILQTEYTTALPNSKYWTQLIPYKFEYNMITIYLLRAFFWISHESYWAVQYVVVTHYVVYIHLHLNIIVWWILANIGYHYRESVAELSSKTTITTF